MLYNQGTNYKRSKFTPDDRIRALAKVRRHLSTEAAYMPPDVLWALKALIPELRTPDDMDTA